MWIEELSNGKYKYFERYKDPYTEKWRKVSVTLESGSNRAKKEAQKILEEKIKTALRNLKTSDAYFTDVLDSWWEFHKKEIRRTSIVQTSYVQTIAYFFHVLSFLNSSKLTSKASAILTIFRNEILLFRIFWIVF